MDAAELLDKVCDQKTFLAFVRGLAEERAEAEKLEREEPERYCLGGAIGWQNGNISDFLYAAMSYFEPGPNRFAGEMPAWRDIAMFLYLGKIYE